MFLFFVCSDLFTSWTAFLPWNLFITRTALISNHSAMKKGTAILIFHSNINIPFWKQWTCVVLSRVLSPLKVKKHIMIWSLSMPVIAIDDHHILRLGWGLGTIMSAWSNSSIYISSVFPTYHISISNWQWKLVLTGLCQLITSVNCRGLRTSFSCEPSNSPLCWLSREPNCKYYVLLAD